MKKILSTLGMAALISTSSLQLISCNKDAKTEIVENEQDENKNKDKNKENKDGNDKDARPLTAKEVADKIEKRFEAKKEEFIKYLNNEIFKKIKNVSDFYKAIEDGFKEKEEEHAKINYAIKNKDIKNKKGEELIIDKTKDATNKVYVGNYNIFIEIEVTRVRDDNSLDLQNRNVSFTYNVPFKDTVIDVNKVFPFVENVAYQRPGDFHKEYKESFKIDEFSKWENYHIDSSLYEKYYLSLSLEYDVEVTGYLKVEKVTKTEFSSLERRSAGTFKYSYTGKKPNGQEYDVSVEISIYLPSDSDRKAEVDVNARIWMDGLPEMSNWKQSIIVNVNKIKLHTKKIDDIKL